jgi:hypothetical protein
MPFSSHDPNLPGRGHKKLSPMEDGNCVTAAILFTGSGLIPVLLYFLLRYVARPDSTCRPSQTARYQVSTCLLLPCILQMALDR